MRIRGLKTHWVLELQKYSWCVLVRRRLGESGRRRAAAEPGSCGSTVWVSIPHLHPMGLGSNSNSVSPGVSIHLGEAAILTGALIYWEPSVAVEIPL